MSCKKCGRCCRQFYLTLNKDDPNPTTKHFIEVLKATFKERYGFTLKEFSEFKVLISGECEHLKDNLCTIYEKRGKICQDFVCGKV
jgi:Fe-S-cluster containining protein